MCRPNGVWIGVMEEECTESEHLPSIAAEECEVEEVVLDDSNLDLEDMLPGDAKEVKIEANVEFESSNPQGIDSLFDALKISEIDRLRCIRGVSKHVGTVLSDTFGESETLHVNDPVCTLLRTKMCCF